MNKRLLLPLLLLVLSCSQSPNVAGGVETGNGFTTGIVVSSSNSPVVAIVKAVPIKFNPSQDTLDHSLIDTTLDNGEYSITLKAGQYNIIAEDTGGAEIALSKNIEIVQDATTDKDITLAENQPYTYTFTDNIHGEGDLYFEGTTFIQHYSSASRSVEFANLPANTWYPPLHRVENGTNAIVANGVITSTAIKVKKTDGFSEFNVLTYDSTRNILWAGSALNDGIFKFSLKGKKLSQDNYLDVAGFTYGITAIEPASNEQMIIGTGRGLFLYDPSLEDKYIAIDAGNSNVNKPVDLFQKDAIIWSAFSDGVYYGSEVVPIAQTSSMSTRDDSIYVGTAAGELFEFSTDNPVPTKRAITLPSIYDIYALSNGKLLVATNQKLSVSRFLFLNLQDFSYIFKDRTLL